MTAGLTIWPKSIGANATALLLASFLLALSCGQPATPVGESRAGEWQTFEGTWTATGTRRMLRVGTDDRAAIFELTGSILLTGAGRPALGFRAQAIGFSDTRTGMQGRCVWTDERGEMVYSELQGEWVGTGKYIRGKFIGGTGRYAGISGEFSFQWQYVIEAEEGAVSGRTIDLKGRARLGTAPSQATAGVGG